MTRIAGLELAAGSPALLSGSNTSAANFGALDFWGNAVPAPPAAEVAIY